MRGLSRIKGINMMVAIGVLLALLMSGCGVLPGPEEPPTETAASEATAKPRSTEVETEVETEVPTETPTLRPTPGRSLEQLLERAVDSFDDGEVEDAFDELEDIIDLYPDDASGYVTRAGLYARQGDIESAIAEYQAALTINPADRETQLDLAGLLLAEFRYSELKDALDGWIEITPTDTEMYVQRALTQAYLGDGGGALDDLQQVQDVLGDDSEVVWINVASLLYSQGEYQQAIDLSSEGLEHFPESTNLLLINGTAYFALGDNQAVIDAFDRLIEIDESVFRAWYLRGKARLLLGETDEAIVDLEQAVAIGEVAGVAGNGQVFEAMADLGNALAVEDSRAGIVYIVEHENLYAVRYGLLPGALLAGRARIYTTTNRIDAALDLLLRAIQRNYVEGYYYRAIVWAQIEDIDRAVRDLETYLEKMPVGILSERARELLAELQDS